MNERFGTQIESVEVEYGGVQVAFQHQVRRVQEQSVCGNVRHNLKAFSERTVKAKELFGVL